MSPGDNGDVSYYEEIFNEKGADFTSAPFQKQLPKYMPKIEHRKTADPKTANHETVNHKTANSKTANPKTANHEIANPQPLSADYHALILLILEPFL